MKKLGFLVLVLSLGFSASAMALSGQETPANIIYADADATGANNGTSWANAYTDLQDALAAAPPSTEIWVAEGTYKPGTSRWNSFELRNDVAICGGFNGTEAYRDERDWVNNVTILSGDIGLEGDNSDNCLHVVVGLGGDLNSTAILDGFTITGGNASGGGNETDGYGGGMFNAGAGWCMGVDCEPTVTNCIFESNSAIHGGGMYNYFASPTVSNCTFRNNVANDGGGMFNDGYWGCCEPIVTNCTFEGNIANGNGGGMYNWSLAAEGGTVTNCTFWKNTANGNGGGMYNDGMYGPTTNCTFSGNIANGVGGGIYNEHDEVVTNCVLWGDTPDEIVTEAGSSTVTYCDVQGGYGGTGNIDADPLFADLASGDFHLGVGSPCIDAGDNAAPAIPPTDFEGDFRIVDGNDDGTAIVDMGVDEVVAEPLVVSGCIYVKDSPLMNRRVILKQRDEPNQETWTGANGCYAFESVVPDKMSKVILRGRVPSMGDSDDIVSGCIDLVGSPLVNRPVTLMQPDEPDQGTRTDANGCYAFESAVPGEIFKVTINRLAP